MKTTKKLAALLLLFIMLFSAVACKDSVPSGSSDTNPASNAGAESEDFWGGGDSETGSGPSQSEDESNGGVSRPKDTSKAIERPVVTGFQFPKLTMKTKTVKVMTVDKIANKKVLDKLKSQYGITIENVPVAWGELPLKLTAAILANDSPDAVIYRGDNPDMPSFVIKNLVQPVSDYTDLNNSIYAFLKNHYKATSWGGKNYILINDYSRGGVIYYNTKLFKDYGVEDPWTLYKQGKWDWNKFAEVAVQFIDDTNNDGEQDRFGFVLSVPPSMLLYTTGEAYGTFDGANKQITNNIKSKNLARCMNFLHELIFKKKGGLNAIATADPYFKNGMAAMTFGEAYGPYVGNATLEYLAKKGQLGIVPLPKDPKADRLYYYSRISGYFIPRGAKNPAGTVALNAVALYLNQEKGALEQQKEDMMGRKYTDLHLEQLDENWKSNTPVLELTPFIGYNSVWLSFQNELPWATQIAQDEPKVAVTLDEIYATEVEAPTGPKVVEDFEKLGTSTTTPVARYIAGTGGSPDIKMYLDSKSPYKGKYNGRIDYQISGTYEWASIAKSLNSTWKTNNTLTLWAKGDGKSDQNVTIQLKSSNGAPFNKTITLTGTGKVYSIPFSEFTMSEWWPVKTDKLNIESMSEIGFLFEDKGEKRFVYLDMIEAVSK